MRPAAPARAPKDPRATFDVARGSLRLVQIH